jgi:hypothetical protein
MTMQRIGYYAVWLLVWAATFIVLLGVVVGAIHAYPYVIWAFDSNTAQAAGLAWCIIGYCLWFDAVQYMVRKYEAYPSKFRPVVALSGGIIALAILLITGPVFLARRWYYA